MQRILLEGEYSMFHMDMMDFKSIELSKVRKKWNFGEVALFAQRLINEHFLRKKLNEAAPKGPVE